LIQMAGKFSCPVFTEYYAPLAAARLRSMPPV
jgi:hypothetical protein